MFCYVLYLSGLPNYILMETVALVLIIKQYFILNRFRKSEVVQSVTIPKSRNIRKTVMVFTRTYMRHSSSHSRFTGLTCPKLGYITYVVYIIWIHIRVYCKAPSSICFTLHFKLIKGLLLKKLLAK